MEEGRQFGHYQLVELIGRGGMGEVWRALDTRKNREVALKLLLPHLRDDAQLAARFQRESEIVARLSEPHVVPIHDYGELEGRLYLEMRLVVGSGLDAVIARDGPLPPGRSVRIVSQIASALDAAHKAGLVHRDVKPSNVLIVATGYPQEPDFAYLVDFGIARLVTGSGLTGTGSAVGTPAFMAPEQFEGLSIDSRADVYSLGCLLFVCLTGRPPFLGDGPVPLMFGHLTTPVPRVSAVRPGIAQAWDEVIGRALAKRPDDRYRTAGELAAAAMAAVAAPTHPAPTYGAPTYPALTYPARVTPTSSPVYRPVPPAVPNAPTGHPSISPWPIPPRPVLGAPIPTWVPAPAPRVPGDVRVAFWSWIVSVLMLWGLLIVGSIAVGVSGVSSTDAESSAALGIIAVLCIAIFVVCLVLLILMRRGRNWARLTLVGVGVVQVLLPLAFLVFSAAGTNALGSVYMLVVIGATIAGLSFMLRARVRPYFRPPSPTQQR